MRREERQHNEKPNESVRCRDDQWRQTTPLGRHFAVGVALATEAVTLYLRFVRHQTAVEFNVTAPLLLQIHHMFWSVPLLAVLPVLWRRPKLSGAVLGVAIGFIASDLAHHFVVLPLVVGNTGWHWP